MSVAQNVLPYKTQIVNAREAVTARAGLPLVVELLRVVFRRSHYRLLAKALGYDGWHTVRRHFESLLLILADGGDHLDYTNILRGDPGLEKLLGFKPSAATRLKDFLYRFHQAEDGRPLTGEDDEVLSVRGHATIRPEGPGLRALAMMLDAVVGRIQKVSRHEWATLDIDATIIEARKEQALKAYEGTIGYQPQDAWWAEQGIWVKDEFRDGNVPAQFQILDFVKRVFAGLPKGVLHRRLRGDSALYDEALLTWLADQQIGFAVSADMSRQLDKAISDLPDTEWRVYEGNAKRGCKDLIEREERQWAEVVYVPDWNRNRSKKGEPLRYIAIRIRSRQRDLYAEGEPAWRHFAVVTNLPTDAWAGDRVLRWHRRKQGTVEYANGVIKNDLGGGVMPCGRFGANAAWWRLSVMAQNLLELLKRALPDGLALARPRTLQARLFHMAGRLVDHARSWVLRLWSDHPLSAAIVAAREVLANWHQEVPEEAAAAG